MLTPEKQRELSEQARVEHEERAKREEAESSSKERKKRKRLILAICIALVIIGGISFKVYSYKTNPGIYDNFAKCLTEKGAVMYGAIEWCQYTKAQAKMFGKSYKYISYQDYRKLEGIKETPTWVINGERYEGVQSFERLAAITGCELV